MPDLSPFPITQRWPETHPDRLQLCAAPELDWGNALVETYAAGKLLGLRNYSTLQASLVRGLVRPAGLRGLQNPARQA